MPLLLLPRWYFLSCHISLHTGWCQHDIRHIFIFQFTISSFHISIRFRPSDFLRFLSFISPAAVILPYIYAISFIIQIRHYAIFHIAAIHILLLI
jgi:hypothetical protein